VRNAGTMADWVRKGRGQGRKGGTSTKRKAEPQKGKRKKQICNGCQAPRMTPAPNMAKVDERRSSEGEKGPGKERKGKGSREVSKKSMGFKKDNTRPLSRVGGGEGSK